MFEMQSINKTITIDGFNSIYYLEFGKDFIHEPEKHDFWEMVYVDNGSIYAITDGVTCNLSQGQAIFHKPLEMHAHISNKKTPNNMLVVSFSTSGDKMEYFNGKTFTLDKTTKMLLTLFIKEAKNALGSIPGDYNNKDNLDFSGELPGASQLMECYFTEFLIRLMRTEYKTSSRIVYDEHSRNLASLSLSERICSYMEKNIYSNLSLNELCAVFCIGKTKLCQIFSDNIGKSPMEYYATLKINEAKKLLRENTYSVTQIADKLGYTTIHNFSRAFKMNTGFSPTAYIKSVL